MGEGFREFDDLLQVSRGDKEDNIYNECIGEVYKEGKRRSKVIEVFPKPESAEKIVYLVAMEMNESYRRRKVKEFEDIKEELVSIRRERYGEETLKETEM